MSYKNPRLTVDGAVLKDNKVLLIKRKYDPFKGKWALPGGFVEYGEKVEDAVIREIYEETGLKTNINKIFGIYSDPNRDPRGHTISIVFLLNIIEGELKGNDDASDAKFFKLEELPHLSFDHDIILNDILRSLE